MQNISELIIQSYRKVDLCRAFDLDLELIGKHVINHLPVSNAEKLAEVNAYEELIDQIKKQGLEKGGQLEETQSLLDKLTKLHNILISSDKKYQDIYARAKSHIDENMKLANGKITNTIQICINGIYGFLLLKLNGREIEPSDKQMIDQFGDVLSYLSYKYEQQVGSN